MKQVKDMSVEEFGGFVCQALEDAGIVVTLTGGSCVAIWSKGQYVSDDLDFIEEGPNPRRRLREILGGLGFTEQNRYFVHPDSRFLVEFPTGPLMVGDERVTTPVERTTVTGTLRLLSPTDCVKDRLAAFYHWKDRQSLEQAVMVSKGQIVDLAEVSRWSECEGMAKQFEVFAAKLREK